MGKKPWKIERSYVRNRDKSLYRVHYHEWEDMTRYTFYWSVGDMSLVNTLITMGVMSMIPTVGYFAKHSELQDALKKLGADRVRNHYAPTDPHHSGFKIKSNAQAGTPAQ